MTKLQTAFASLIAVVPAGILCYVLVMGLMNHMDAITGVMPLMVGVGLVLLCCLAVVFSPALVFLAGGGDDAVELGSAPLDQDEEMLATGEFDELGDEGFGDEFDDGDDMLATGEFESMDDGEDFGGDDEWGDEDWDDEEWDDEK